MVYPEDPPSIYDRVIDDRDYCKLNGEQVPIRESVIDQILEQEGDQEVALTRPDGTEHVVGGNGGVPDRETLLQQLVDAQRQFGEKPVTTLTNLSEGRLGPLVSISFLFSDFLDRWYSLGYRDSYGLW